MRIQIFLMAVFTAGPAGCVVVVVADGDDALLLLFGRVRRGGWMRGGSV